MPFHAAPHSLPSFVAQQQVWSQELMESLPPLDSRQDLTHMLRSWGLDEKYIRLMLVSQRYNQYYWYHGTFFSLGKGIDAVETYAHV